HVACAAPQPCFLLPRRPPMPPHFPYTTLFRSERHDCPREHGLVFENVSFRYPDAPAGSPPVLHGIDLHIRRGESLALVGATESRSEEHTSELQSRENLVCRLLLEKKKSRHDSR